LNMLLFIIDYCSCARAIHEKERCITSNHSRGAVFPGMRKFSETSAMEVFEQVIPLLWS
jgi:hypothetical protein